MTRVETVEEFEARGGRVEQIPRGAMAEAGWTSSQMIRVAATGNTGSGGIKPPTPPESVPVTGVHRQPNQPSKAMPEPRSPSAVTAARATKATRSPTPTYANRNGSDGAKTRAILQALAGGWISSGQIAKATGQDPATVCARLNQLHDRGAVIRIGKRPRTLWALPGTAPRVAEPGEFDALSDLQLLDKARQAREQVRECNRLIVRLEREIKARTGNQRGRAT